MTDNWIDLPMPVEDTWPKPARFEPLRWAKKNCPSYITNDGVQINGQYHYRFYFGQEQDQLAFALKWL